MAISSSRNKHSSLHLQHCYRLDNWTDYGWSLVGENIPQCQTVFFSHLLFGSLYYPVGYLCKLPNNPLATAKYTTWSCRFRRAQEGINSKDFGNVKNILYSGRCHLYFGCPLSLCLHLKNSVHVSLHSRWGLWLFYSLSIRWWILLCAALECQFFKMLWRNAGESVDKILN